MTRRVRSFESASLRIEYDPRRCIHAEECIRGLPAVFDNQRRPWIDPSGGESQEIVEVVERCPTGALQYRRTDGGASEEGPATATVRVAADGPLYLRGRLRITLPDGEVLRETRAALCRCGRSEDKPFCDNSHAATGFADPGTIRESPLEASDDGGSEGLEVAPATNGPILVRGALEIRAADGSTVSGRKGALCRCGHSGNKPFCDGTHKTIGFEAG